MHGELVVRLVQNNNYVIGNQRKEPVHRCRFQHRASWIVGVGDKYQPCIGVDRVQNRAQIKRIIPHGSFDELRSGRVDRHRIDDE